MEPTITDGSYCVFERIGAGSRKGKIVLVQHRSIDDPETGGSYTVKEYSSDYWEDAFGERGGQVTLLPHNDSFEPIVITSVSNEDVTVIARFVRMV